MKQPLQKFEFATSILRFAKDHGIPMETVKEAIELLHRDICGTPSTVAAVNEENIKNVTESINKHYQKSKRIRGITVELASHDIPQEVEENM